VREFAYQRPRAIDDALELVATDGARFLAGGTNLIDLMKLGVETPGLLVDVTGLLSREITDDYGGLRIGAGTSNSELAANPLVRQRFPVLSEATLAGASGQLRNMATVGGNLLQRTRCAYFQDVTKPCNLRRPGSGCPAREGEHHNLAILGASRECIATHPSDMAVALAALDASVQMQTGDGSREIGLDDLYATRLASSALITEVRLAPLPFATNSRYMKVRERASYAFAIASVAAALDVVDGEIRDVRLAFGAVAPKPWRARLAEDALRGRPPTEDAFRAAIANELAAARPLRDNGYKVDLVTTIAVRALVDLAAAA
jgi:xanthine dehydrogenase YagS FAD-binding subunit